MLLEDILHYRFIDSFKIFVYFFGYHEWPNVLVLCEEDYHFVR